jgi:hypothetical protein
MSGHPYRHSIKIKLRPVPFHKYDDLLKVYIVLVAVSFLIGPSGFIFLFCFPSSLCCARWKSVLAR